MNLYSVMLQLYIFQHI